MVEYNPERSTYTVDGIELTLAQAREISDRLDREYAKEDLEHMLQEEYNVDINDVPNDVIKSVIDEYLDLKEDSEEWWHIMKNAITNYAKDVVAAKAGDSNED